jgi:hypothetical protein
MLRFKPSARRIFQQDPIGNIHASSDRGNGELEMLGDAGEICHLRRASMMESGDVSCFFSLYETGAFAAKQHRFYATM